MRRQIGLSLRFSVFERDRYTCQYCGRRPPEVVLHVDHAHPVALGGTNQIDNLLTACRECNIGKGARDPGLAMPTRPPTVGEKKAAAKEEAIWWAEGAFAHAAPQARALIWEIAAKAEEDGSLLILPLHDEDEPEREAARALLRGLVCVGAIRVVDVLPFEWWVKIEERRGNPPWLHLAFTPARSGPIAAAPSVSEVFG